MADKLTISDIRDIKRRALDRFRKSGVPFVEEFAHGGLRVGLRVHAQEGRKLPTIEWTLGGARMTLSELSRSL